MMKRISNKTLLIIGAGFGQLPAIYKSLELGLNTIVVDKNPHAVGMQLANKSYPIDIIDKEALLKLSKEYNIDGVMTMQTDLPIPSIGYINDQLKLNGVGYLSAMNCSYKSKTRIKLKSKGISQPKFKIVDNTSEALEASKLIGFPVIVKAVDSSGSRGVTKVENESKIVEAFLEALKYSRQKDVLVEEYVEGIEIGAQAFSENGKCKKVLIHNDTLATGSFMVPTGHSFPSFIDGDKLSFAEETIKKCVEALEIANGPSNIDLIFDKKDGKAKIIEVGARIGATCLPELVKYYSGIDWVEATILNALGEKIDLKEKCFTPVAAEILEAYKDGILKDVIIPDFVKNHKDVKEIEVTAKIGEKVSVLRKGTDRIGKIIVTGKSYFEAEELVKKLKSKIIFNIE